jgi:protein-S-isoprenylcysteine O-methyltransferase Ste14
LPLVIGIALNVAADRQFKHHQTTVKPFERSSALVTAFPFSLSRNPMYVGITLMLAGVALLLGTVSPLLPVAAFAILMDIHFVRMEERMLAEAFGSEWDNYRARVRRWL